VLAESWALAPGAVRLASTSSGQCWSLTNYAPCPGRCPARPPTTATRPASPPAMLKDLKLAQEPLPPPGDDAARRRRRAAVRLHNDWARADATSPASSI